MLDKILGDRSTDEVIQHLKKVKEGISKRALCV
jgi:hypothetical protein